MIDIFIGKIDIPVSVWYNSSGILQYDYDMNFAKILLLDNDFILINNKKFKRMCSNYEYYISEDGMIYSNVLKHGFIKRTFSQKGYLKVGKLFTDKLSNEVHMFVYKSYIGNPKGMTIDHIDGNKLNNHYTNLELVTAKENIQRGYITEIRDDIKWDISTKKYICQLMEDGINSSIIAKKLNIVDRQDIRNFATLCCQLRNGSIWSEVACCYDFSKYNRSKYASKLTDTDVDNIRDLLNQKKLSILEISKIYHVNESSIRSILHNKTHKSQNKYYTINIDAQDIDCSDNK